MLKPIESPTSIFIYVFTRLLLPVLFALLSYKRKLMGCRFVLSPSHSPCFSLFICSHLYSACFCFFFFSLLLFLVCTCAEEHFCSYCCPFSPVVSVKELLTFLFKVWVYCGFKVEQVFSSSLPLFFFFRLFFPKVWDKEMLKKKEKLKKNYRLCCSHECLTN